MRNTIDMAREVGDEEWKILIKQVMKHFPDEIERFVALVRADERDDILRMSGSQWFKSQARYDEAIRARSNT